MNVLDRLRLESALVRYDFWLEMRGVRGSRRRELRRELRANLTEATADVGATRALFGIGSPQQLAYAATEADPTRPTWSLAMVWASLTFAVLLVAMALTSLTILPTVDAADTRGEVSLSPFPWFGTTFTAEAGPGSFGAGVETPWPLLVLPLLVLVLGARPWLPLRRSHRATVAGGDRA